MEKINHEIILERIHWRYATKKFDKEKKISADDWHALEETLRFSPSSLGLQPWKFIVAQSAEVRQKLMGASGNRSQIETCSHLVIVTRLKVVSAEYIHHYFQAVSKVRDVSPEKQKRMEERTYAGFMKEPMTSTVQHWTARQVYIAMGMFMAAAALLGIDVCPMEGLNANSFDEILGINESPYGTVAMMAAGYRDPDDDYLKEAKVRFERDDVIEFI